MDIDQAVLIFLGFAVGIAASFCSAIVFDKFRSIKYQFFPRRSAYQSLAFCLLLAAALGYIGVIVQSTFLLSIPVGLLFGGVGIVQTTTR